MRMTSMLFAVALLVAGGTSLADPVIGGVIYCAPGLDASGKVVTKCTNASQGGGQDPGTGGWQTPYPGWDGNDGVSVIRATYGWNCGASLNNALYDIGTACDGATSCSYTVDYRVLGDPAPGCAKTFQAAYTCPGSTIQHGVYASAEAGFGSVVTLKCQ